MDAKEQTWPCKPNCRRFGRGRQHHRDREHLEKRADLKMALLWLGRQNKRAAAALPTLTSASVKKTRECFSLLVINRKKGGKKTE